jgi:hypothetical protein
MGNANEELKILLNDFGAFCRQPCTDIENEEFILLRDHKQDLPEGIYRYKQENRFYRLVKDDVSEEEINRLLMLKQIKLLIAIKNSMIFFTILAIISLFFGVK